MGGGGEGVRRADTALLVFHVVVYVRTTRYHIVPRRVLVVLTDCHPFGGKRAGLNDRYKLRSQQHRLHEKKPGAPDKRMVHSVLKLRCKELCGTRGT